MTTLLEHVNVDQSFRGYMTRAEADGVLTFTAVTAGVKRDGLEIDLAGLSTDNFMRNPVFLWVHDYWGNTMPIGKVTSLSKETDALVVSVTFDMADPFAAEVHRKYVERFLNAVSIGWDTLASDGNRITESDLLDISAVPVPGDEDALIHRAEAYARTLRGTSTTSAQSMRSVPDPCSPPCGFLHWEAVPGSQRVTVDPLGGVSVVLPDDRPLTRAATVEQIDQTISQLQELREELVTEQPAPEPEPAVPLEEIASLLGGT